MSPPKMSASPQTPQGVSQPLGLNCRQTPPDEVVASGNSLTPVQDHPLAMSGSVPNQDTSKSALQSHYVRPPVNSGQNFIPAGAVPRVFAVGPSNQSLDAMADAFLSADGTLQNPKLRPLPLPATNTDMDRVRALVVRRAWGDVLSIIHNLLRGASSHYVPIYMKLLHAKPEPIDSLDFLRNDVVELMLLQCHAWLKMRRYNEIGHELRQWKFLDDPPAWIPNCLRIVAAAAWQYVPLDLGGGPQKAIDALHSLRGACCKSASDSVALEYQLCNILCRQKSWRMALQALDRLSECIPEATQSFVQHHYPVATEAGQPIFQAVMQCEVWSRQGRIFLQIGALDAASSLFDKAKESWNSVASLPNVPAEVAQHPWVAKQLPAQVLHTNMGMLYFSYRQYSQASEAFRQALDILNHEWSVDGSYRREDWVCDWGILPPQHRETLYAETMNNISIAALYSVRDNQVCNANSLSAFTNLCANAIITVPFT